MIIMKTPDLSLIVKGLCMRWKTSRYTSDRYDGSDEWIQRRLLEYANISRDLTSETSLRANASHAYTLIHDLCEPDRQRIRHLYNFYQTARKLARGKGLSFS